LCYQNKYTIKSINSRDSIQARNPHSAQNVDYQLRNLQFIEIVDFSSEYKISRFNFLVDLKVQSKHHDNNCPVRMYTKLFEFKKWLNMELKTDKREEAVISFFYLK